MNKSFVSEVDFRRVYPKTESISLHNSQLDFSTFGNDHGNNDHGNNMNNNKSSSSSNNNNNNNNRMLKSPLAGDEFVLVKKSDASGHRHHHTDNDPKPTIWILLAFALPGLKDFVSVNNWNLMKRYHEHYGVDPGFLSIGTMIGGTIITYFIMLFGYMSDRTKSKYGRRKPFIMILSPLMAICVYLLYIPEIFSQEFRNLYIGWIFIVFFSLWKVCDTGLWIVTKSWSVELSRSMEGRTLMYSIVKLVAIVGHLLGSAVSAYKGNAVFTGKWGALTILFTFALQCIFVPTHDTPQQRHITPVPLVAGIRMCMLNSQFRIMMIACTLIQIQSSIPMLVSYLSQYVMDCDEADTRKFYALNMLLLQLSLFITTMMQPFLKKYSKLWLFRLSLILGGPVYAPISYWLTSGSCYLSLPVAVLSGIRAAILSVSASTLLAATIDYDEFITGMRRTSMYQSIYSVPYNFMSIVGPCIPLIIIELVGGFETDNLTNVKLILRYWSTIGIGGVVTISYFIMNKFQLSEDTHEKIMVQIFQRDRGDLLQEDMIDPILEKEDDKIKKKMMIKKNDIENKTEYNNNNNNNNNNFEKKEIIIDNNNNNDYDYGYYPLNNDEEGDDYGVNLIDTDQEENHNHKINYESDSNNNENRISLTETLIYKENRRGKESMIDLEKSLIYPVTEDDNLFFMHFDIIELSMMRQKNGRWIVLMVYILNVSLFIIEMLFSLWFVKQLLLVNEKQLSKLMLIMCVTLSMGISYDAARLKALRKLFFCMKELKVREHSSYFIIKREIYGKMPKYPEPFIPLIRRIFIIHLFFGLLIFGIFSCWERV